MEYQLNNQPVNNPQRFQRVLSSDSHIIEPPDLWITRADKKLRDIVPRVERIDGSDWWIYRGQKIGSVSGRKKRSGGNLQASSVHSKGAVLTHSVFEDVIPAAYTPDLYLKENLRDGVVGMVIRPTQGITNYCISDPLLFSHICRAYNDWMIDFCSIAPANLKGIAMLNNYDPDDAVRELERVKSKGMVGGIISVYPGPDNHYGKEVYEKLWSAAAAHDFPLSLHVLTNHNGPYGVGFPEVNYSLRANADYWVRMSLSDMIFAGVFERHPKLQIESSEHEGGWLPYYQWQMDWIYNNRILKRQQKNPIKQPPGYYLKNNIHISIIYDDLAIQLRDQIGVERIMWGSDFPHEQSTHPNSLTIAAELLKQVPSEEARMILLENTAKLYQFDLKHPHLQTKAAADGQHSTVNYQTEEQELTNC